MNNTHYEKNSKGNNIIRVNFSQPVENKTKKAFTKEESLAELFTRQKVVESSDLIVRCK